MSTTRGLLAAGARFDTMQSHLMQEIDYVVRSCRLDTRETLDMITTYFGGDTLDRYQDWLEPEPEDDGVAEVVHE